MEHGEHHVHAHAHGEDEEDEAHHDVAAEHAIHGEDSPKSEHQTVQESYSTTAEVAHETQAAMHDEHVQNLEAPHGDAHEAHGEHGAHFDPQDMMNMGGLRKTMPVTFWTFLLGGMSLAGFPLLTAGFWSKDEILADAWHGVTEGYGLHAFVFIMLALAAFLTAFYTMRQLGLTFWGDARTEEAKHANLGRGVVSVTMTLPLIILAFFAVTAGFVGVHPNFPLFGAIFSPNGNPFAHFVGGTLLEEPPELAFSIVPVLFSFAVALGGLYAGWLLYWRKPLVAGEPDPLINILGERVHTTLRHKYYVDEVYTRLFVIPSQWFSRVVVSEFIDRGIIDGFLHFLARAGTWIGDFIKVLNTWLIDGVGDSIPRGIAAFGAWFRRIQTGRIQQYLLLVLIAAILIALVFAVSSGVLVRAAGG
jgi:NADH-quinone oxidoreductase subunit L